MQHMVECHILMHAMQHEYVQELSDYNTTPCGIKITWYFNILSHQTYLSVLRPLIGYVTKVMGFGLKSNMWPEGLLHRFVWEF